MQIFSDILFQTIDEIYEYHILLGLDFRFQVFSVLGNKFDFTVEKNLAN